MANQINQIKTLLAVFILLLLVIATRGHANWLSSWVHLPDFTIPALLIAGVYFRSFSVAFIIIVTAVLIDNYAIIYDGMSANCITPGYGILLLSYYFVFWSGQFLTSLAVDKNIIKNALIVVLIVLFQWLLATLGYYAFTASTWAKFPAYAQHWLPMEVFWVLSWVLAVAVVFTLAPRLIPFLSLQKSGR